MKKIVALALCLAVAGAEMQASETNPSGRDMLQHPINTAICYREYTAPIVALLGVAGTLYAIYRIEKNQAHDNSDFDVDNQQIAQDTNFWSWCWHNPKIVAMVVAGGAALGCATYYGLGKTKIGIGRKYIEANARHEKAKACYDKAKKINEKAYEEGAKTNEAYTRFLQANNEAAIRYQTDTEEDIKTMSNNNMYLDQCLTIKDLITGKCSLQKETATNL